MECWSFVLPSFITVIFGSLGKVPDYFSKLDNRCKYFRSYYLSMLHKLKNIKNALLLFAVTYSSVKEAWVLSFFSSLSFSSETLERILSICTWLLVSLSLCSSKDYVFLKIFETVSWWAIKLLMLLDICFDSCSVLSLIIFLMVHSSFFPSLHFCLCLLERMIHWKPKWFPFSPKPHEFFFFPIQQVESNSFIHTLFIQ